MRHYTENHEWIDIKGDTGTVGISPYAIDQLGDIVFIELPDPGTAVAKGEVVAVFESVKAASDIYCPVNGEIVAVNDQLLADLSVITPERAMECWLYKIKLSDTGDLDGMMDEAAYNDMIA